MSYRYLGYGVSDASGVAKLDHDPNGDALTHSYTGSGAGKIDIIASTDSTISSSSLVSQPYPVWDCVVYDDDTSASDSKWTPSSCTLTRTSDYSKITDATDVSGILLCNTVIPVGSHIFFDVYQVDGANTNFIFNITKSDGSTYLQGSPLSYVNGVTGAWQSIEIIVYNNKITVINHSNNDASTDRTWTDSVDAVKFRFRLENAVSELRFKNFKVYPI